MGSDAPSAITWRELAACAVALAVGIALLPAVGGGVLWTHPLWLDELCCTIFPTEHAASPLEVVTNLARRQDYAPPLLHLIVWTVGRAAGGMTPVLLRTVALASVAASLILLYAALRRRFAIAPSAAGSLAVAAHPLVIMHAFEGRFYGPWMLFAAGYAWAAGRRDRLGSLLQAMFAVCVVTIHWFGIISLALMAAAVALSHAPRWRDGLRAIAPGLAGLAAFMACLPLLSMQSAGASAFSWIEPFETRQAVSMARVFFLSAVPVLAAIVVVVDAARRRRPGLIAAADRMRAALRQPSVSALVSLVAFPAALVLVSVMVQPAMIDRYAITTLLCWGPLVAFAMEPLPRAPQAVALAALLLPFKPSVATSIEARQAFTDQVFGERIAFERVKNIGGTVVFPWLHVMYPVVGPNRGSSTPARMLDVPDSALAQLYPGNGLAWFRRRIRVEALSARSHTRVYGFPIVVTAGELDTVKRFVVMTSDLRVRGGAEQARIWGGIVFPHHTVLRLDDYTSLLIRK